ncbi:MarR family winged helix-turn-helix transcriptional regulator [Actinomadura sp. WAC 06369]|uniref:MarR family winged helix-turn-helix transcriptional regulator n=1 Tax=Actinomadura sp. WAC 06369 TaxID=2203193 RepID=UPI000F76CBBE|nr:MarR family winged helix-turn-helix transcriptional regulator [Actinomadura sp. WAC 06369]RSN64788.1 MarR family transcriptional regulator [Actinomadura sp. WAC 06369]
MNTADSGPLDRLHRLPSWLIAQASAHSHRLVTDAFAAVGARGYHYRLLAALDQFGPASQAELGRSTGIDRSDVVAALNELAADRCVDRAPDPADRRRNIVTLTPDGARRLRRLDTVIAGVQDDLLAPLPPADRDRLVDLLARLTDHHAPPG